MENLAVWLHGPGKAPKIGPAPISEPGPGELLIHAKAVAIQPAEWKIQAGLLPFPMTYPAIIGTSLAGVVEKVGPGVTRFAPGDRVACNTTETARDDHRYGADQRFVLAPQELTSKIGNTSFETAADLSTGYGPMSALFLHLGLPHPSGVAQAAKKDEKILIWGVSSSFGSFAAQVAALAGYDVVGVASGRNAHLAKEARVTHFVDRTASSVVDDIVSLGPFKAVLAAADSPEDQAKLGSALAKLGGGHFMSTLGVYPGVVLPEGVTGGVAVFVEDFLNPENTEFTSWVWWDYLEKMFAQGAVKSVPVEIVGGLSKLPEAWDTMREGKVSGKRLIVSPELD